MDFLGRCLHFPRVCVNAIAAAYFISAGRKLAGEESGSLRDVELTRGISRDYGKDSDLGAEKSNSISAW